MSRRRTATGLCFPTAVKEAGARGGEVVHALVTHPVTRQSFWHAWVERDGRVYDDTGAQLPVSRFYEMFEPVDVRRYSDTEAMVYAVRTGHHGPWEPGETGSKPRTARKRIGRSS